MAAAHIFLTIIRWFSQPTIYCIIKTSTEQIVEILVDVMADATARLNEHDYFIACPARFYKENDAW